MKHATFGTLIGALAILMSSQASGQGTEVLIACRADFSPVGGSVITVQITKEAQGTMQAQINGKVSNLSVKPEDHSIREKLNLKPDPYSEEFKAFNNGEISLAHLASLMDNKDLGPLALRLPFALGQVKKMRIYDMQGKTDKFGGTVLMEAYGADGKLLGRVFRSLFASSCT